MVLGFRARAVVVAMARDSEAAQMVGMAELGEVEMGMVA